MWKGKYRSTLKEFEKNNYIILDNAENKVPVFKVTNIGYTEGRLLYLNN